MLPSNNEEFLSIKVVSQSTARAIILIAELIFATKSSWKDPTKHSFVQGKDISPILLIEKVMMTIILFLQFSIDGTYILKIERITNIKKNV
jgi:hypothetical protein